MKSQVWSIPVLRSLRVYRGVVNRQRAKSRQEVDWKKLSNSDLKFAYDTLSLHHSIHEVEVANEVHRRLLAGTWFDLDAPPPPLAPDVPQWLYKWPFCLLWAQRPK